MSQSMSLVGPSSAVSNAAVKKFLSWFAIAGSPFIISSLDRLSSGTYTLVVHHGMDIVAIIGLRCIPQAIGYYMDLWVTPDHLSRSEITRWNEQYREYNRIQGPNGNIIQLELSANPHRRRRYGISDLIMNIHKHQVFLIVKTVCLVSSYFLERNVQRYAADYFNSRLGGRVAAFLILKLGLPFVQSLFTNGPRIMSIAFQMDHVRGLFFGYRERRIGQGTEEEGTGFTMRSLLSLEIVYQWSTAISQAFERLLAPSTAWSTLHLLLNTQEVASHLQFERALDFERVGLARRAREFARVLGTVVNAVDQDTVSQAYTTLGQAGIWGLWAVQSAYNHSPRMYMVRRMVRWAFEVAPAVRGGMVEIQGVPMQVPVEAHNEDNPWVDIEDDDDDDNTTTEEEDGSEASVSTLRPASPVTTPPLSEQGEQEETAEVQVQAHTPEAGLRLHSFIFVDAFGIVPLAGRIGQMSRTAFASSHADADADARDAHEEAQLLITRMFYDAVRVYTETALTAYLENRQP